MLTLFLTVTFAAPALKEKPKPEAGSIVGDWVMESGVIGGKPRGRDPAPEVWTFRADGTRTAGTPGAQPRKGTYTVDNTASPRALDMTADPMSHYQCIFRVEGDTLTLNIGWQKAARPTSLESPDGSQCTLYVFKRIKPDRE